MNQINWQTGVEHMSHYSQRPKTIMINVAGQLAIAIAIAAASNLAAAQAQQFKPTDTDIPTEHQEIRGYLMVQGVNTRTGNFARTYPAFERHALTYRRTYNSHATNRGTFGLAWGSSFDTRAVTMPDGRVAVLEGGNGATTVYGQGPVDETQSALDEAVVAAQSHPIVRRDIRTTLAISSPYAQSAAAGCDNALLTTVGTGFVRTTCAGRVEIFNTNGWIVGYTSLTGGGPLIHISRDASGRIGAVWDEEGHRLRFAHTTKALKVSNEAGDWLKYSFDTLGRNTAITGKIAPTFTFDYGADGLLRQINYIDTTTIKIDYSDGRTTRLTLREGDIYDFEYLPDNQTRVTMRLHDGTASRMLVNFLE